LAFYGDQAVLKPLNGRLHITTCLLFLCLQLQAQVEVPHPLPSRDSVPVVNHKRAWIVGGAQAVLWAGTLVALNEAWYKDYPKQPFHFFNDWPEWQQQDKFGHAWTTYHISRLSSDLWRWTGMTNNKAAVIGGISSIAYLSIIEVLDGFSEKWGFSTGDMAMNIAGAALYTGQQIGWRDQKFQLKLSYRAYDYLPMDEPRAEELFGTGAMERVLKDYNAQTYWLSFSPRSFFPGSRWPAWLNLAIGHNARLMLGGRENTWTDENGNTVDRTDAERYRRIFLSLDLDLTRIPTRNKFLKSVFSVVNMLKIPAPALEFDTRGHWKGHWVYY
jgi:hypothetical protein